MIYLQVTIVQISHEHALYSLTFRVHVCAHVPLHVEPPRDVVSPLLGYFGFMKKKQQNRAVKKACYRL